MDALTALSPLDGRYRPKTQDLRPHFSEAALIRRRVEVEVEWLIALSQEPQIPLPALDSALADKLRRLYRDWDLSLASRVKAIEATTNHDVKAVEYLLGEELEKLGQGSLKPWVHFACTSEDINNLCHGLMMRDAVQQCLVPVMQDLLTKLEALAQTHRAAAMMSRTHGQPASPTTMGKELQNVAERFKRQLAQVRAQQYLGK